MPPYVNYGCFSLFLCCCYSHVPSITWFQASSSIDCTTNNMLDMWQMITSSDSTQGKKLPRCHPFLLSEEKKDSLELILCLLSQADLFCSSTGVKKGLPAAPSIEPLRWPLWKGKLCPPPPAPRTVPGAE